VTDLRRVCNGKTGRNLSHIRFNSLPSTSAGQLYVEYTGPNTGTAAVIGTDYYDGGTPGLSYLVFVPNTSYEGTVTLTYQGYDTANESYSGTITLAISSSSSRFTDMENYSWAVPAVEYLAGSGVVSGISNDRFGPSQAILRCDFVIMLCNAFGFPNSGTYESFLDVPTDSYYAQAVATAKSQNIIAGDKNGLFHPLDSLTRQDAMVMLYRALVADGHTPAASTAALSGYVDSEQVADYARQAVAALVELGAVSGTDSTHLSPRASITRAEVAVILHRLLTA
jgi:hypothetical protein